MNDAAKAVMFNVLESNVPLMIHLRLCIRKILPENQMPVHNPRLPQNLRRLAPISLRLHHNPQQWLPHQFHRIPQPPQPYFPESVAAARRSHDYDLPSRRNRNRILRFQSPLLPILSLQMPAEIRGSLRELNRRRRRRKRLRSVRRSGGGGGELAGGSEAGEEAHGEAEGEVDDGFFTELSSSLWSLCGSHSLRGRKFGAEFGDGRRIGIYDEI